MNNRERLNEMGIPVTKTEGEDRTVCPKCSEDRKKKKDKCLAVNVSEGVWTCWHCGFKGNLSQKQEGPTYRTSPPKRIPPPPTYASPEEVNKTLRGYDRNNFVSFLISKFGVDVVNGILDRYPIGTSKHWPGANIFWQVDIEGKVRGGKIMLYSKETGTRIKEPFSHITWVHDIKKIPYNLSQCLYGEHLLPRYPTLPVGVVESEKTAIVCSVYLPSLIWVAVGGKNEFKEKKLSRLKGRRVVCFPDLNGVQEWTDEAGKLPALRMTISSLISDLAADEPKGEGADLADYLLDTPLCSFVQSANNEHAEHNEQTERAEQNEHNEQLNNLNMTDDMRRALLWRMEAWYE